MPCCAFHGPSSTICSNPLCGILAVSLTPLRNNTHSSSPNDIEVHSSSSWNIPLVSCPVLYFENINLAGLSFGGFPFYLPRIGKLHFQPSFSLEIYPAHNITNVIRMDSIRSVWVILLLPSKVRYWKWPEYTNTENIDTEIM